jgi:Trk-type K+ transport system membrane component
MIAACFAIGSVGFFLAVLLEHNSQSSTSAIGTLHPVATPASLATKEAIVQSLGNSAATSTSASSTSGSTSGADATAGNSDASDSEAAAKLKVLESLNDQ